MTEEVEEPDSDTDVFERAVPDQAPETDPRWVALPPATLLSLENADALLRWRDASVIAIVGERKGGKTTLITELYERFLRGEFAGALFTHSLTLLGFERKSFQSRAESCAESPDTPRTSKQDGLTFFHLGLTDAADLRRTDLLISERAGEVFREVRDRPSLATGLIEIRKARVVAFIVDGERVADPRLRAEALASARHIARAMTDAGAIPSSVELQVVTTKCDLLAGEHLGVAREALGAFEEQFAATYERQFAKVSVFRTAARDPKGAFEAAFGLVPLVRSWLRLATPPSPSSEFVPQLFDEFDRLLVRVAP